MRILGIETSCDETAAAVVADGNNIMSNIVASQIDIHSRYGGIVPEVASRQHVLTIVPVISKAMSEASVTWQDIDGIAVTFGPGLAGSLLVGVNTAKAIALATQLPIAGINHLEAHIYANWLTVPPKEKADIRFPCLCLIVSGGHSDLILMRGHGQFEKLGRTRDDAAGEAFDKAARILNLGYPGGPAIERVASSGTPHLALPRAWLKGSHDFSFSGLKTALWHLVQKEKILTNPSLVADAAASFQYAIVDVLVAKTIEAAREFRVRQILLSGGVAANKLLTERLLNASPFPARVPPPHLCTDNAAMVAACGYYHFQNGQLDGYELDVVPSLSLGSPQGTGNSSPHDSNS
ncbi:MAG: tRNA (adenosine(37)-N6)-threonylcarbamoyltransferase complex transferase subunit TsaD [Chloroflexi bacterium]|nr:tRNA (adenosine(37)-N6)-threonylcarbamoyltransferase complex transferase subunit TsaD [Chloroflexota bacterium]MCK4262598.1 tRNA (adenosine(37)-N6)-threonylcarbamoyltransferase complex transferase subunit TsaD [Dehalococcoidia bacterium]MCK4579776.1 tRNA (adenosine(37)-N6)-threonylcarbamoyltransferase complex transferase subunit TsaD [Dehalococcoidia bacterium]